MKQLFPSIGAEVLRRCEKNPSNKQIHVKMKRSDHDSDLILKIKS
jgi:hypothetical protein